MKVVSELEFELPRHQNAILRLIAEGDDTPEHRRALANAQSLLATLEAERQARDAKPQQ